MLNSQVPSAPVLNREQRRDRKRKKPDQDYTSNAADRGPNDKALKPMAPSAPKQTGVFVANLPLTATKEQIAQVFSKAGVLLIDDEGAPRIKLYHDESGAFKGEALILYFKEGSVELAIRLLDDTELEYGAGVGNMKVKRAEYSRPEPDQAVPSSAASSVSDAIPKEKKKLGREEKAKMSKRIKTLQK